MSEHNAMTKRALVLAILAAGLGRLAFTDAYQAYVRPGMRIPLLASVAVLAVLSLASAWTPVADDHDHDHDHDHHAFPRIGYWLVVPVLCIAIVPILPLGADAVGERRANVVAPVRRASPAAQPGAVAGRDGGEMKLLDFVSQAVNDPEHPFTRPVTLVGFVSEDPAVTDGFVLGRFVMSCCAADAQPLLIHVRYEGSIPAKDRWVRVTGRQVPPPEGTAAADRSATANLIVEATSVTRIAAPRQPYETL